MMRRVASLEVADEVKYMNVTHIGGKRSYFYILASSLFYGNINTTSPLLCCALTLFCKLISYKLLLHQNFTGCYLWSIGIKRTSAFLAKPLS